MTDLASRHIQIDDRWPQDADELRRHLVDAAKYAYLHGQELLHHRNLSLHHIGQRKLLAAQAVLDLLGAELPSWVTDPK